MSAQSMLILTTFSQEQVCVHLVNLLEHSLDITAYLKVKWMLIIQCGCHSDIFWISFNDMLHRQSKFGQFQGSISNISEINNTNYHSMIQNTSLTNRIGDHK